jgi:von Willebrand factor type A domain
LYHPLSPETPKQGKLATQVLKGEAQREAASLSELGRYDIVLVVDRSGSMSEPVDGSGTTKWQWCSHDISEFTGKIKPYLTGDGIELVTFNTSYTIEKNCTPDTVNAIFAKQSPEGSTDLAAPLKALFDQHFRESPKRPMLIAVLTDGMPNRGATLNDLIIDATRRMHSPDEIRLVFMQVGNEFEGRALLETLDQYLVHNGAAYDIVDSVAFGNMRRGILDPLIVTIRHDWHPVIKPGTENSVPPPIHTEASFKIEPPPKKPSEP